MVVTISLGSPGWSAKAICSKAGDHRAARDEAQVAALVGGARVLAELPGQLREVLASREPLADRLGALAHLGALGVVGVRGDAQQDVAGPDGLGPVEVRDPLLVAAARPLRIALDEVR